MGYQVIKQPNDRLCIFSSFSDTIIVADATSGEVIEWFARQAAERAREDAGGVVDNVMRDEPNKSYYQFTMTYAEAVKEHRRRGGRLAMVSERA